MLRGTARVAAILGSVCVVAAGLAFLLSRPQVLERDRAVARHRGHPLDRGHSPKRGDSLDRERLLRREPPETSGAMDALDFWTQPRAYPARVIPDRGHADGFAYSRAVLAAPEGAQGKLAGAWRALGPRNIGGRTLVVAFNPQNASTVYAGSAGGGLWRSRTGGVGAQAWAYVPTGFPVLAVSTIAIASTDSDLIYIGTGEVYAYQNTLGGVAERTTRGSYGIGILKTTDGGKTWTKSLDWSQAQRRGVWTVRIDPGTPSRVWAATTEGVFLSQNAGVSWTPSLNVVMATDLEVHPARPDTVLVACGNFTTIGFGIYRTLNGGQTWTHQTSGLPFNYGGKAELASAPSSPNTVYASIGNGSTDGAGTWLARSTNAGETWAVISTIDYANYQGWFAHDIAVDPADPNRVYTVGVDIWKTGPTPPALVQASDWRQSDFGPVPIGGPEGAPNYSHADHHCVVFHPSNRSVAYFGTDGGVFRTIDGGSTFQGCNGGYQTGQFYNGFASAATDTVPALGGLQDNYTAIFQGTPAWNRQIGGDGGWAAIDRTNPQTIYGSWQYLNLLRSYDGGANWQDVTPPGSATFTAFVAPYLLAPSSPGTIYAARNLVYRSFNQGTNWSAGGPINGNMILALAVSATDPLVLYAGTVPDPSGRCLYRSANGGASWTNITGTLPNRYPMDIALDPADHQIAYVALSGFGTSHLFRTPDSGVSWQDIGATLPDVPTSAVIVDPLHTNHVLAGNDLGVYVSFDTGATWQELRDGLPDAVIVMDLSIAPAQRRLRVATHGNGVYERPLPDAPVGVALDPPPRRVLAALGNAPNPFNPRTTLHFTLGAPAAVSLDVFDLRGRRVRALLRDAWLQPGEQAVVWDGQDDKGLGVASGPYVARVRAAGETLTRGLTLVK